MTHLVCYASENMSISQNLLVKSAWEHGVNNVIQATPQSIPDEFWQLNQEILDNPRGVGYWLWKPYIIYKTMLCDFVKEGDFIFYSDSGTEIVDNLNYLTERIQDIMLFAGRFKHAEWCKMDVIKAINYTSLSIYPTHSGDMISMNGYEEKPHVQASHILLTVNEKTKAFVKEWLMWCQMPGFIDDSPSKLPNHPHFAEHRHDQAILTCLQIKYNIPLHWWPATMNMDRQQDFSDTYPALFNHHRKRNDQW